MRKIKIVLIGAGSASFGRGTLADIMCHAARAPELGFEVVLVDVDAVALERMRGFAEALRAHRGVSVGISATTDRCEALPGADYVITAVSVSRNDLWDQDFAMPLAYGFRHPYGECGGPGAAFHTLRSLHIMIPICQDMERLCPEALLLNYTNPESRVCLGVQRLTKVQAIGLCHGAFSTWDLAAALLGRERAEVEIRIGGINHFHWLLGVTDSATGACLMDAFHTAVAGADLEPLTRFCYETFGLLPFPSDSHIAEYLPFGYEFIGPHYLRYQEWVRQAGEAPRAEDPLAALVAGGAPMTDALAAPTEELAVPIIMAREQDLATTFVSGNVPNTGCAIANLPEQAIVEAPIFVNSNAVVPIDVGPLPEAIAALCRQQLAIQELIIAAYGERSRDLLYQALLLEPTVDDTRRARQMMEEMLRQQAAFLPEFE